MKFSDIFSFIALILLYTGCNSKKVDYELISTYQDNSVPMLEVDVTDTTKVLVIVPHADDETVAGGLIAHFKAKGASIHLLTLCAHNEIRTKELKCSASALGIDQVDIAGFTNNSWNNIMENNIEFWYEQKDSIENIITAKINVFKPDYLITYDAEIGGYGHPEHRISAELTEKIFEENKGRRAFAPKSIFQITLSDELEKFLVSRSPGYKLSKELTGSAGLPSPDVAIDIKEYWPVKNKAANCHQSQIKILKKFYIVYEEAKKENHINAFNKEYYRVVDHNEK